MSARVPTPRSRRDVLSAAAAATATAVLAGYPLFAQAASACADPAALPEAQKARRRSLAYVEPAPDPKKRCGLCFFFKADQSGCGTCQLMAGGPVSASGVCISFAAKGG